MYSMIYSYFENNSIGSERGFKLDLNCGEFYVYRFILSKANSIYITLEVCGAKAPLLLAPAEGLGPSGPAGGPSGPVVGL